MRRRTFASSAAAAAVATAVPGIAGPRRVGHSEVGRLEAKFAAIIAQDHRFGGLRSIETQASALAGEALSLLQRGTAGQRVRNNLYACAASFTSSAL